MSTNIKRTRLSILDDDQVERADDILYRAPYHVPTLSLPDDPSDADGDACD